MVRQIDDTRVNIYQHSEIGPCFYGAESDRGAGSADNLAERLAEKAGDAAYSLIVYEVADHLVPVHDEPFAMLFLMQNVHLCSDFV